MRVFSCNHCGHAVFFENVQCLNCASALAFLPDLMVLAAIEPSAIDDDGDEASQLWRRVDDEAGSNYRMCGNQIQHQACNFAVRADDPHTLCVSCRQTRMAPDLSIQAKTYDDALALIDGLEKSPCFSDVYPSQDIDPKAGAGDVEMTLEATHDPFCGNSPADGGGARRGRGSITRRGSRG